MEEASTRPRRSVYNLHVELDPQYEPLRKRNKVIALSNEDKQMYRMQGQKNIDLWVDGKLYPIDPFQRSPPPFRDITSLLNYVGDGQNGLLGYTYHLDAQGQVLKLENELISRENLFLKTSIAEAVKKLQSTDETIKELEKEKRALQVKQSTLGLRKRIKKLRDFDRLKVGTGGIKKRVRAIKSFLHPQHSSTRTTEEPSHSNFGLLINREELQNVLTKKKFKKIIQNDIQSFIKGNTVDPQEMQEILDQVNVSQRAYSAIYKTVKARLEKSVIKGSLLPHPASVRCARLQTNEQVLHELGEPFHIQGTYSSTKGDVEYNQFNNIFYDLEALQCLSIRLFEIYPADCDGVLKFVIKLDECEIVKNRKLERVTITLMNRALDPSIGREDPRWFSVQCKNNIFPLGSFEVPTESFDILYWVFHKTQIPEIISEQRNGKTLHVQGMGDYQVEWHMAGDLKTLKCMFNVSKGANSKSPCLYCMNSAKTLAKPYWKKAPDRHIKDPSFKAVLDIPLCRVHICTLHALCRIIEKLLYLYICFAWTLKPRSESEKAINALEKVLSEIGLHGGNVKIEKDEKRSSNGRDVPKKASIGGVKARRFLSAPSLQQENERPQHQHRRRRGPSTILYNKWKAVHNTVVDHADGGHARTRKANVWKALDTAFKFCDKRLYTNIDLSLFEAALEEFKKSMIEGWTDQHITHYMHILYNHTPWFARKYGGLSTWSTQGMEKTHYQARSGYFKHTRHGGGRDRANSLKELHQWTYRNIMHRFKTKERLKASSISKAVTLAHKQRRREAWLQSTARSGHSVWRQTKERTGKVWVDKE